MRPCHLPLSLPPLPPSWLPDTQCRRGRHHAPPRCPVGPEIGHQVQIQAPLLARCFLTACPLLRQSAARAFWLYVLRNPCDAEGNTGPWDDDDELDPFVDEPAELLGTTIQFQIAIDSLTLESICAVCARPRARSRDPAQPHRPGEKGYRGGQPPPPVPPSRPPPPSLRQRRRSEQPVIHGRPGPESRMGAEGTGGKPVPALVSVMWKGEGGVTRPVCVQIALHETGNPRISFYFKSKTFGPSQPKPAPQYNSAEKYRRNEVMPPPFLLSQKCCVRKLQNTQTPKSGLGKTSGFVRECCAVLEEDCRSALFALRASCDTEEG